VVLHLGPPRSLAVTVRGLIGGGVLTGSRREPPSQVASTMHRWSPWTVAVVIATLISRTSTQTIVRLSYSSSRYCFPLMLPPSDGCASFRQLYMHALPSTVSTLTNLDAGCCCTAEWCRLPWLPERGPNIHRGHRGLSKNFPSLLASFAARTPEPTQPSLLLCTSCLAVCLLQPLWVSVKRREVDGWVNKAACVCVCVSCVCAFVTVCGRCIVHLDDA
jgi:hypothetical protein